MFPQFEVDAPMPKMKPPERDNTGVVADGTPLFYGLPEMAIHAPIPPVKHPREPMTKEELARAMHKVQADQEELARAMHKAQADQEGTSFMRVPFDELAQNWQQMWLRAAEEAIRRLVPTDDF